MRYTLLCMFVVSTILRVQAQETCPIPDNSLQETNFADAKPLCDVRQVTGRVSCDECLCGLSSIMYRQLSKVGVDVIGLITGTDPQKISQFFTACQAPLALQLMLTSGLSQQSLLQLGDCNIASIPTRCIDSLRQLAADDSLSASDASPGAHSTPEPVASSVLQADQSAAVPSSAPGSAAVSARTILVAGLLAVVSIAAAGRV